MKLDLTFSVQHSINLTSEITRKKNRQKLQRLRLGFERITESNLNNIISVLSFCHYHYEVEELSLKFQYSSEAITNCWQKLIEYLSIFLQGQKTHLITLKLKFFWVTKTNILLAKFLTCLSSLPNLNNLEITLYLINHPLDEDLSHEWCSFFQSAKNLKSFKLSYALAQFWLINLDLFQAIITLRKNHVFLISCLSTLENARELQNFELTLFGTPVEEPVALFRIFSKNLLKLPKLESLAFKCPSLLWNENEIFSAFTQLLKYKRDLRLLELHLPFGQYENIRDLFQCLQNSKRLTELKIRTECPEFPSKLMEAWSYLKGNPNLAKITFYLESCHPRQQRTLVNIPDCLSYWQELCLSSIPEPSLAYASCREED